MDEPRHRQAERTLWQDGGVTPTEHRLHLERNDVDVRVQEVGEGPPVVFVHGGPGASGSIWAHLVARLPELRCLLLDRPGCGLSDPQPLADPAAVRRQAESLVPDVLDALGIPAAHVVGSSHGGWAALLTAAAHPARVQRTVVLGSPGLVEGMVLRFVDRLGLMPGARHLFSRMPASEKGFRSTLRQMGHAAEADRYPPAMISWAVSVMRDTDTMYNDVAVMERMGTLRHGFDASLYLTRDELAAVRSPTAILWGTNEVYGDEAVARRLAGALPDATLEMLPDAGHLCWFDDLDRAAEVVRGHVLAVRAGNPPAN